MKHDADKREQFWSILNKEADANLVACSQILGVSDRTLLKWRHEWRVGQPADTMAALREKYSALLNHTPVIKSEEQPIHPPIAVRDTENIVLGIPDYHAPFGHQDAIPFLKEVRSRYKPNIFVNLGDEVDFHAFSRFPKNPDGYSAGHELSKAIEQLIPMYREFPEMLVCESNHTVRGHKKAFDAEIPNAFLKRIETVLHYPEGWQLAARHEVDGVIYKHGTGSSGENAHKIHAKKAGKSTVIGHIHAHGGVAYLAPNWFAVNAGCLIDQDAYCFAYAKDFEPNIVLGCAVIFGGQHAQFIPMHLDKHKRWTGRI